MYYLSFFKNSMSTEEGKQLGKLSILNSYRGRFFLCYVSWELVWCSLFRQDLVTFSLDAACMKWIYDVSIWPLLWSKQKTTLDEQRKERIYSYFKKTITLLHIYSRLALILLIFSFFFLYFLFFYVTFYLPIL